MRLLIVLFSLILGSSVFAAQMNMANHIELKGKTPKGVVIHKHKVTIKKGYEFEKVSDTKVVARMRGGGHGISGEFDCTCNGDTGGCSAVTTPNSVTCASSGCTNCYMIVTIPDKTPAVMH